MCIISFNLHRNLDTRQAYFAPSYQGGNWDPKKFLCLSNITQLGSGRVVPINFCHFLSPRGTARSPQSGQRYLPGAFPAKGRSFEKYLAASAKSLSTTIVEFPISGPNHCKSNPETPNPLPPHPQPRGPLQQMEKSVVQSKVWCTRQNSEGMIAWLSGWAVFPLGVSLSVNEVH